MPDASALFSDVRQRRAPHFVTRRLRRFSLFPGYGPGQSKKEEVEVVSNDPWRTVSVSKAREWQSLAAECDRLLRDAVAVMSA